MQQRISDGKGSRNWKNDLCEKAQKGCHNFDPTMFHENHFVEIGGWIA